MKKQQNKLVMPLKAQQPSKSDQSVVHTHKDPFFPYEPYPSQFHMASLILKRLLQRTEQQNSHSAHLQKQVTNQSAEIQLKVDNPNCPLLVFESPTGTGKTMALLAAIIQWMINIKDQTKTNNTHVEDMTNNKSGNPSQTKPSQSQIDPPKISKLPSWLTKAKAQAMTAFQQSIVQSQLKDHQKHISEAISCQTIDTNKKMWNKQQGKPFDNKSGLKDIQDILLSDDCGSQHQIEGKDDYQTKNRKKTNTNKGTISSLQSINQLPKLIYVSRTHTQLEQVAQSLQALLQARKNHKANQSLKELTKFEPDRQLVYIHVASKDVLCVNQQAGGSTPNEQGVTSSQINASKCSQLSISDRCRSLVSPPCSCPFYTHLKSAPQGHLLLELINRPLKQFTKTAHQYKLCPYYAAKSHLQHADIILVPYATIVDQDIRSKLGIQLDNNIVVFDEGHHLIKEFQRVGSCTVDLSHVQNVADRLRNYVNHYEGRMAPKNKELLFAASDVLHSIAKTALQMISSMNRTVNTEPIEVDVKEANITQQINNRVKESPKTNYVSINNLEFLAKASLKFLSLSSFKKYCERNHLVQILANTDNSVKGETKHKKQIQTNQQAYKLKLKEGQSQHPFNNKYLNQNGKHFLTTADIYEIFRLPQILLTQSVYKIILQVQTNNHLTNRHKQSLPRYTLTTLTLPTLSPLGPLIESTKLTIIAGGTLTPLTELRPLLLEFRCPLIQYPHIIKKEQCQVYCVSHVQGQPIRFTKRDIELSSSKHWQHVGAFIRTILKRANNDQGIVIFAQKYDYVPIISQAIGQGSWKLHIDRKDQQGQKRGSIFQAHRQAIDQKCKSVLISVMGGKLSQGKLGLEVSSSQNQYQPFLKDFKRIINTSLHL